MKKRSLSHFAYYAANRAFPVFLLLLLLLGFTACSAEKGAKALDYPAMFGETKDEVLTALDEEKLTYKEDDLYANAYVLDRTETLENPTDADCKLPEKLLNTLTAQYGEPTTYPGLENRISTHLDHLSTDAVGSGEVYNEYWSVSENCDASLGVSFLPDGRLFVDIVCQTPRT